MFSAEPLRRMQPILGTYVEIGIAQMKVSQEYARETASAGFIAAFSRLKKLHDLLSFQQGDSELSSLNQQPGQWLTLSADFYRLLSLAKRLTEKSQHLFNCTVAGALIDAGRLPNHGGNYLAFGSSADILLHQGKAKLARPIRITLDGIAKGFAVDCAVATLKKYRVTSGWINAGGDLRCFGEVTLPVHVRALDGGHIPIGQIQGGALATSQTGNSSAFPGLIMNPQNGVHQTPCVYSVISRYAWRADALTKVAANAPVSEKAQRVAELGGQLVTMPNPV